MEHHSTSLVSKDEKTTVYFSEDQKQRFDLCVFAKAKSQAPFPSVTHLFSRYPPFHPHLSISFLLLFPSSQKSDHTKKFIEAGGMPVEVKCVSGVPSASAIILYGWCSGGAFITLNYTLRLLPLPPGLCRTALALSSYNLTQEEPYAGNYGYMAQHLPSTCESLNFTFLHAEHVMYVVHDWHHGFIYREL